MRKKRNSCDKRMLFEFCLKVTVAKSEEDLVSLKLNGMLVDSLVNAGWLKDLTLDNRNLAMQTFMVHFVLQKRKEPLSQLWKGLKTLGVLDLVRAHPGFMLRVARENNIRNNHFF